MSVTLQFQSTGTVPGNARPVRMLGPSLTIGRGSENDLVLPDPDRLVSKTHCVIEEHGGRIFAVDLSTNGTFLNYSKVPMGREPTPINNGDVLSLGPYELVVEISDMVDDLPPPVDIGQASHGRASAAPDPLQLLDDAPPGADFLDSLLGDPKGPTGPRNLKIGQFDPDALLPPLEEDGPLLGIRPQMPDAPAMRDHSPAITDSFRPAQANRSVIPDDWEDDLLAPAKPAGGMGGMGAQPFGGSPFAASPPPFAPPAAPRRGAAPEGIPDDFDDLLGPATSPAPTTPPTAPPFAPPPVAAPVPPPPPEPVTAAPVEGDADYVRPEVSPFVTVPPVVQSVPPVAMPVTTPVTATNPPATQAPTGAEAEAIRAFMAALGTSDLRLTEAELVLTMSRLGATLREMIIGLREILMTRSSIKSEFRIDQTMITAGKNNPLKFSVSPELAIESMTRPSVKGYLDADEAARQALDDIKAHEIGMVTGMEAALKGVLARLDPNELTSKIESTGGISAMFRGKKAQYWETYEKMYAEISDQAENDFHDLFAREFSQAYKDQLKRLKDAKG
jgi:predicted component of type VI protein secretion system